MTVFWLAGNDGAVARFGDRGGCLSDVQGQATLLIGWTVADETAFGQQGLDIPAETDLLARFG